MASVIGIQPRSFENPMLDLNDFRYFVEVVDRGGFSAAARALQRPTSTVSYRIQQLERELGLTLLARTSRQVVMTQAGEEFYGYAAAMLERANEAEVVMRGRSEEPAGTVHYTVATWVAQFAMPNMLLSFLARHPKIKLVQHSADANVDIVAGRYDLAIRLHFGDLPDSQLIRRPLADVPWHLFASPEYVSRIGSPESPGDLNGYDVLFMNRENSDPVWDLRPEGEASQTTKVRLQPRLLASCMVTLKQAAEMGTGIVALPAYICRDEVRSGQLQRVLPNWVAGDSTVTALMPNRLGMTAATRAFIDHIVAEFPSAVRVSPDEPDSLVKPAQKWQAIADGE
jgi:DNA-binding transcriptional LysR family regulator